MGSWNGKLARRVRSALAVFMAVSMAVSLNPVTALAQSDGAITHMETGERASSVQAASMQTEQNGSAVSSDIDVFNGTGAASGQVGTNINVAVTSSFKVVLTTSGPIDIRSSSSLAMGGYEIEAELSNGTAITKDTSGNPSQPHYEYKWIRQIAGPSGTFEDDQAYNDASQWKVVLITSSAGSTDSANDKADVALNLADENLDFANDAQYKYKIIARDASITGLESDSAVIVNCNTHYVSATLQHDSGVSVSGLVHVGDTVLGAENLLAAPNSTQSFLQNALAGKRLDCAYDISLASQLAVNENKGHTAYLAPLESIHIPVSPLNGETTATVVRIARGGSGGSVETLGDFPVKTDSNASGSGTSNKYVELTEGSSGVSGLGEGVYAVAFPDTRAKVNVTSVVSDGVGGLIDIMGTHEYAAGTNVRYVFLPFDNFVFDKVMVAEGSGASSVRSCGSNYLDYTVPSSGVSSVTITAYFKPVDTGGQTNPITVNAAVKSGEGTVAIEDSTVAGSSLVAVMPGGSATINFTPQIGSVLEKVVVTPAGEAPYEPAVINNSLKLTGITKNIQVDAYFKFGTPITYPKYNITYAHVEYGDLSGNSQVEHAKPATITARPYSDYRLTSLYYTFNDKRDLEHHELIEAGGFNYSIPNVLGDITVFAKFDAANSSVWVDALAADQAGINVSYVKGDGTKVFNKSLVDFKAGIIGDIAKDSDLTLNVSAKTDYRIEVNLVADDGSKTAVNASTGTGGLANAVYKIDAADLAIANRVEVRYVSLAAESLNVMLVMPDEGAVAKRDGSVVGTGYLTNIDPNTGLDLVVELASGYKNLTVKVQEQGKPDAEPTSFDATTNTFHFDKELLGDDKVIRVSCEKEQITPPGPVEPEKVTVTAVCDGAGSITPSSTEFKSEDDISDITYTITAPKDYVLDYVSAANSDSTVRPLTFFADDKSAKITGVEGLDGRMVYTFKYDAANIKIGYVNLTAHFREAETTNVWTVDTKIVDTLGNEISPEDAHGIIWPGTSFTVKDGQSATLTFEPKNTDTTKYYAEYNVNGEKGTNGQLIWSKNYNLQLFDVHSNQNVLVRFIEEASQEQPEPIFHSISVNIIGNVGGVVQPPVDSDGKIKVKDNENMAFSFFPDTDNDYVLSYIIVDKDTPAEATYSASALSPTAGQYIFTNVKTDHTLDVMFAKKGQVPVDPDDPDDPDNPDNPDDPTKPSYVEVDVTVSAKVTVGSQASAGVGGRVEPSKLRVKYGDSHDFFVYLNDGYKLASLEASVDGGSRVPIGYSTRFETTSSTTDISAIGRAARFTTFGLRSAEFTPNTLREGGTTFSDSNTSSTSNALAQAGIRHHVFTLSNLTGDVEVFAEFEPLAEGEEDEAVGSNFAQVPQQMCTVRASSSGNGSIDPSGELAYGLGSKVTFTLTPAQGYQPVSVTVTNVDGNKNVVSVGTSYTLTVSGNCEVVASFSPIAPAGSNSSGARAIRTLRSLAQTGDVQAAGVTLLLTVACGALGVAVLSSSRRRQKCAHVSGSGAHRR
ncbi:hypothetical protein [Adlercreutzia sp. ZJ154]|uniref:InlB B-repeat-containing protein n=1 Tax=Adlercreutzia sp. ZJ154 TaxID=2709790 RepID=UPI0013EA5805|nr:hypothetical protein [Adlercreutzia sp. ZJ154]